MTRVFVTGLGAVSPAGWGLPALRRALESGKAVATESIPHPGRSESLRVRRVNEAEAPTALVRQPRLRRASSLSIYSASAAVEAAVGLPNPAKPDFRIGLVVCLQAGCIHYSCRFFQEMLADPATASPLIFPETVFGAPASHVAALIDTTARADTLIGDAATFLQGVALGAGWLVERRVDACLVIGAEECNQFLAEAFWQFERHTILSNGAGALCLSLDPALSIGVELAAVTDAHPFSAPSSRAGAARAMRAQLPQGSSTDLLCDGLSGNSRPDAPERAAWADWSGPRLSLKPLLGEGLMAAAAWQCVAACDALAGGRCESACVSLVGGNQQALGARFIRHRI